MSNSSSTYAASNPGTSTYYLRAYKTNCWGASVGVTVTVNAVPGTPWPVVSQSTNTCGYKTLTATPGDGPPPSGVSWHWQGPRQARHHAVIWTLLFARDQARRDTCSTPRSDRRT
jgi:hypothetical protein